MGNRKKKPKGGSDAKAKDVDASLSTVLKQNPAMNRPGTGNRAAGFEEIAHQFVVAGGQRYIDFFKSLFTSWRDHGSLPPLSTEESAMLSQLYRLWLDSRQKSDTGADGPGSGAGPSRRSGAARPAVDRTRLGMGQSRLGIPSRSESWRLAVEDVRRETGKEHLLRLCSLGGGGVSSGGCSSGSGGLGLGSAGRDGGMRSIVSHLDVLLKAPEPTKTHAKSLLMVLSSPDMRVQDLAAIEQRADDRSASHAVALGFIYDSQLEATAVKRQDPAAAAQPNPMGDPNAEPSPVTDADAADKQSDCGAASSVFAQRCFQLYQQAADMQDSIAAMQLGGKYLRGEGVPRDAKLALKWYTRAAGLNNPIAQHKVGYFFDEGLPGACPCNIAEAVRWYTLASDYMPDSVHNLAKIAEDGRGGRVDMQTAVTMYSIAAARGFPLSQVNLGRLFLLGEDGVRRDREAGKRLLTLAAESGDSDAQMVVGMIHATPAFECFDLALSEFWLRSSVQGGKTEAELLLVRVCQQMQHAGISVLPSQIPQQSRSSAAARQRGDDYLSHDLADAAALEYTRAYELDKSQADVLVARMDALFRVGQLEECLDEGTQLLLNWGEARTNKGKAGKGDKDAGDKGGEGATDSDPPPPGLESPEAAGRALEAFAQLSRANVDRASSILAESMVELHWAGQTSSASEVFRHLNDTCSQLGLDDELCAPVVEAVLRLLLEEKTRAQKAFAFVARITARGSRLCRAVVAAGGIPILVQVMVAAVTALVTERNKIATEFPSGNGGSSTGGTPYDSEIGEVLPLESICANGAAAIANMVRLLEPAVVTMIAAADGFPLLIKISCCKQVDLACEALQALSNVAVQADESAWRELMDAGIVSSFVDVIAIALEDLGQLAHGVALEGMTEEDRESLWQDIFEVLAGGISALSRVMEVCPVEFTQSIAGTPLMSRLHKLFRMDVLPNRLRNITAFVLYNMTCARDPGACKVHTSSLPLL
jgi:TPR repeat protein